LLRVVWIFVVRLPSGKLLSTGFLYQGVTEK